MHRGCDRCAVAVMARHRATLRRLKKIGFQIRTLPDGSVAGRNRNVMLLHLPRRVRGSLSPTRHVRYWGKFGKTFALTEFFAFSSSGFSTTVLLAGHFQLPSMATGPAHRSKAGRCCSLPRAGNRPPRYRSFRVTITACPGSWPLSYLVLAAASTSPRYWSNRSAGSSRCV